MNEEVLLKRLRGAFVKFLPEVEKAKTLGVDTSQVEATLKKLRLKPRAEETDYQHVLKGVGELKKKLEEQIKKTRCITR